MSARGAGHNQLLIANPERALWQAVLLQAVEEALHGPKGVSPLHRARMWQEARDYMTTPCKDLEMVCSLAGVEMDAVVERMKVRIALDHQQILGRHMGRGSPNEAHHGIDHD